MKILSRLKLAWHVLRGRPIQFTVTMIGPDQKRGWLQQWVFWLKAETQMQDFAIIPEHLITAHRQATPRPGYENEEVERFMREAEEDGVIVREGVRDAMHSYGERLAAAQANQLSAPMNYVDPEASEVERKKMVLRSWKDRQPKHD